MKYKIVFFGSSHYSIPIVTILSNSNDFEFKGVITKEDGEELFKKYTPTGTRFYTLTSFKSDEGQHIIDELKEMELDLVLVADYGLMIPKSFFKIPKKGFVNIHFSDLPQLRGASPVQYTILKGLKKATYTFLDMVGKDEPEMDSGDIVYQNSVELTGQETTESLYTTLFEYAAKDLEKILIDYLTSRITPLPQDHALKTFTTPSEIFDRTTLIKADDAFIDHSKSDEYIERAIRAFTPWPKAWTTIEELFKWAKDKKMVKEMRPEAKGDKRVNIVKGHIDENKKLQIDELQVEGKKKVNWHDFANGYFR